MKTIDSQAENPSGFSGAKLLLFLGQTLVVIRRDDKPDIPFPGHWDLPGGGRDGRETPVQCVLRETREEVGLIVPPRALCWARSFDRGGDVSWMFAAHMTAAHANKLVLGDEGQEIALMLPSDYATHALSIPHFVRRMQLYLSVRNDPV